MKVIGLYLIHAPGLGSGWRHYVIVKAGRKWARLASVCTYLDTAKIITVPVALLKDARPVDLTKAWERKLKKALKKWRIKYDD